MCVRFDTSSQRTHFTHYTPLCGVCALCPWRQAKPRSSLYGELQGGCGQGAVFVRFSMDFDLKTMTNTQITPQNVKILPLTLQILLFIPQLLTNGAIDDIITISNYELKGEIYYGTYSGNQRCRRRCSC